MELRFFSYYKKKLLEDFIKYIWIFGISVFLLQLIDNIFNSNIFE